MPESSGRKPHYVFVTDADSRPSVQADRPVSYRPVSCAWRLIAANNRPMGRSTRAYRSLNECRGAADQLRSRVAALTLTTVFDAGEGRWTWQVSEGDELAAQSVRTYLRRFECRRAATQYLDALSVADPAKGVVRTIGASAMRRLGLLLPDATGRAAS